MKFKRMVNFVNISDIKQIERRQVHLYFYAFRRRPEHYGTALNVFRSVHTRSKLFVPSRVFLELIKFFNCRNN